MALTRNEKEEIKTMVDGFMAEQLEEVREAVYSFLSEYASDYGLDEDEVIEHGLNVIEKLYGIWLGK